MQAAARGDTATRDYEKKAVQSSRLQKTLECLDDTNDFAKTHTQAEESAFLVPSPSNHRCPGLVTIAHTTENGERIVTSIGMHLTVRHPCPQFPRFVSGPGLGGC
jgi:hypothetical protein